MILEEIERDIQSIAGRIGAVPYETVTVGSSANTGMPCVLEENGAYVWQVQDNGRISQREVVESRDEILYRAAEAMTWMVAYRWAKANPVGGVSTVDLLMARRLELTRSIDEGWYRRSCRTALERLETRASISGLSSFATDLARQCREALAGQ